MASKKRAYAEEHRPGSFRVMLTPETLLWGGFKKKWAADCIAEILNTTFDEVEADVRQKLLDEKKCCAIHCDTELISGLGCSRCGDTVHCPVCCMEATREEACNVEDDERRKVLEENKEQREVFSELLVIAGHHWADRKRKAEDGDHVTHEILRQERMVLDRAEFELEQDT